MSDLKILSCATGKIECIIENSDEILGLVTNKDGTVLVAATGTYGDVSLFNITSIQRQWEFSDGPEFFTKSFLHINDIHITVHGTYLLFTGVCDLHNDNGDIVDLVQVYNLKTGKEERELIDNDHWKQDNLKPEMNVGSFVVLDDARLLSSHKDFIFRIFNYTSGQVLQRFEGCESCKSFSYIEGCNVLLTNYRHPGIRLWDTDNFKCLTAFYPDVEIYDLQMVGSNPCRVIAVLKDDPNPVVFTLKGNGLQSFNFKSPSQDKIQPDFGRSEEEILVPLESDPSCDPEPDEDQKQLLNLDEKEPKPDVELR